MKLKKHIRISLAFYTTYSWLALLITISCAATYYFNGYKILANILGVKIVLDALICYFINTYKKKEFYYYRNLSISKTMLWTTTLIFDFGLFILTLLIVSYIR